MDECPSCGGPMEPLRERHISITLRGADGGDHETATDDDGDIITFVCADCGYREDNDLREMNDGVEDDCSESGQQ